MAPISEQFMELEAKRKEDSSWHPCRVSVSSNDAEFGIVVDFENLNEEDIITNREEALTRLRFRSTPLKDGDCIHIKEGECVLAMYKGQSRSMPVDAVIEKLYRVKHSNRVFCRCTFEIKWLVSELEEERMIVPSKSIMKLSNETIETHPTFAGFLNALSPIGGAEVASFLSLYEEADSEADLHGILEKQIEEISRLADGSKECSKDSLLEVKRVHQDGGKHMKPVNSSSVSSNISRTNFRRSTRSQNKQQVEVEFSKDLQEDKHCMNHRKKYLEDKTFLSPLKKDLEEERPFLSPLAARAAFASLIHETPVKAELSAHNVVEKENHQNLVPKDSTCNTKYMKPDDSFQDGVPSVSNTIQCTDSDTSLASQDASRCSNCKGATQKTKLKKSLYKGESLQASEGTKCGNMSNLIMADYSTACGSPSACAVMTRLTRSLVQKEIAGPSDEQKNETSSEKVTSPMNSTRVTRSHKQLKKNNPGANQELKRSDLTQDTHDIHEVTRPVNTRVKRPSKQIGKSNTGVNKNPKENDQVQDTHDKSEVTKHVNSTCLSKQITTSMPSVNQKAKRSVKAQDKHDLPEDLVTSNKNGRKNKRLNSSEDPVAELALEKSKRTRISSSSSSTKEDAGKILGDDRAPSKKKKTGHKDIFLKKPEQRFSPRLKFLPRTRSQAKV